MIELSVVQQIAVWIIPVLTAITLHEAAHAFVAHRLGDNTARMLGRLSLNPIKHVDLTGTVVLPLLVMFLSQFHFVFGWAKPVPVNPAQFKNPRRDIFLSTAAGPLANMLMAFLWAASMKAAILFMPSDSMATLFVLLTAKAGVIINLVLAFLNLIPVPPLDGSKILMCCLPPKHALQYQKIEPYGLIILLLMIFTGVLNWLIGPLVNLFIYLLSLLFNL